ncbi:hypothetical protein H4S08_004919 [Coemansia sp. RSA 1365]|nr:hypothetical protein H4S08_004919 [Coemansia sp. RSA 1365]
MRDNQVPTTPPVIPEQATSKPAAAEYHPRVSCETFSAQATKFSGTELYMLAVSWVKKNKCKFDVYLPGMPEQMRINAAYQLLMGDAKTIVRQHIFDTMSDFYTILSDTFLQSEYKAKLFEAICSGSIFKYAPKHALGTYALAVYKNLDQATPTNAAQIARALFNENYLPFIIMEIVLVKVLPQEDKGLCHYFDHANNL